MLKRHEEPVMVTRSSLPPLEEYVEMLKPIWDSAWLTNMGEYHETLKEKLKTYLKTPNLELFVNGHMALELTLQAMKLTGEVITTPFSFASTTHAIVRNGLTPVFCDINEEDYTIDVDKLESLITEKTSAIVPVHVYGNPCDVKRIQEIADRHGLKVIYDAAHTFGEELDGVGIGEFGDASMFSFHATKVFHSIEGGAVAFHDPELKDLLYQLKNFGITGYEQVEYVGANGKMNEFQAAMGLCNLRHVDDEIAARRHVHDRYMDRLDGVRGLRLPPTQPGVRSNYAYFPVVFAGGRTVRDAVCEALDREGVYARKYFYPLVTDFECYRGRAGFDTSRVPVARRISDGVVTLPLYPELSDAQVDLICRVVREVLRHA